MAPHLVAEVVNSLAVGRQHSVRRGKPRLIRRWPRRILIVTNVVVILTLIAIASAFGYVQFRLDQIGRTRVTGLAPQGSKEPGSQSKPQPGVAVAPFTLLIIGSDTRSLASGQSGQFGSTSTDPGQRSDSIVLVRVVPATKSLALFSIPRDTLVYVPGFGTTKINAAFNSGPSLLVEVLAQDFGIQVNHVAQFNFNTFEDIANAIGGVYQWFPGPAKDAFSGLHIAQGGCVLLTGAQALAFARSREYQYSLDGGRTYAYQQFPESDLGRIQRQQDFVKLAAGKVKQLSVSNAGALNSLLSSLTNDVKLDTAFSNSLILSVSKDFRSADLSNIPAFTYPTTNSSEVSGALVPERALGNQEIQQWLAAAAPPSPAVPTPSSSAVASTTTSTSLPSPVTTVRPSSIAVEVVNGSGASDQAGLATAELRGAGYSATATSLTSVGHASTVIDYAPDALADAKQLQGALQAGAVLTEDPALTPTPYNLELVTGQDFSGLAGATSSSSTPTTTGSTTTLAPQSGAAYVGTAAVEPDSSSFYKGHYIPPGRESGQIPQTCPA